MSFCTGCQAKIKKIWKNIDQQLVDNVNLALHVTTTLKSWLSSDIAVIATNLIPGNIDDVAREAIIKGLDKATEYLGLLDFSKDNPKSDQEKILLITKRLAAMNKPAIEALLAKIGSKITESLDQRYKGHFYDLALQAIYSMNKIQ